MSINTSTSSNNYPPQLKLNRSVIPSFFQYSRVLEARGARRIRAYVIFMSFLMKGWGTWENKKDKALEKMFKDRRGIKKFRRLEEKFDFLFSNEQREISHDAKAKRRRKI